MLAALLNFDDITASLLRNGANPWIQDKSGKSAFRYAITYQSKAALEIIKKHIKNNKELSRSALKRQRNSQNANNERNKHSFFSPKNDCKNKGQETKSEQSDKLKPNASNSC